MTSLFPIPISYGQKTTIWAFCNFKMKIYLKCHVIHHYLRVRVWMCKMIDAILVLGGAWQRKRDRKWQWRQQIKARRGWTEKGPTHKRCRQGQTWTGGGGAQGDKKGRERRREQEMPVCRWEAWKPEGNLNRLWLPLRHDRLLIPIPSLFLTHSHTHMQAHAYTSMHTQASHACWHTKL